MRVDRWACLRIDRERSSTCCLLRKTHSQKHLTPSMHERNQRTGDRNELEITCPMNPSTPMASRPRANLQPLGRTTLMRRMAIPLVDTMMHHAAKYDIECRVCGGLGFSATIRKDVSRTCQPVLRRSGGAILHAPVAPRTPSRAMLRAGLHQQCRGGSNNDNRRCCAKTLP